jgi:hypothetical protein
MPLFLDPATLTVVCRQPLVQQRHGCAHNRHTDDCCGAPRIDGKLPEGHEHSTDCCEHDCDVYDLCDSGYIAAPKGTHRQCAETAAFTGEALTAAVDQAVAAGWWVDVEWLGFHTRADVCPGHNGESGSRIDHGRHYGLRIEADSYASAT